MADQEKKRRSQALSNFTRAVKSLNTLLDANAPSSVVFPQFEKTGRCWEKLESAQDSYIEVADLNIEEDKDGLQYLDEPGERHEAVLLKYSNYCSACNEKEKQLARQESDEKKTADEEERKRVAEELKAEEAAKLQENREDSFRLEKTRFLTTVEAFKRMNTGLEETVKDASISQKKSIWDKIEAEFDELKKNFIRVSGIDPRSNLTEVNGAFRKDAEEVFLNSQKWMLGELKDATDTSGGGASQSDQKMDHTKKEPVQLPDFQGCERCSPYLKFPVWKKQWETMIYSYEEKWRAGMLMRHLDETARNKCIGSETNYEEAMKRLTNFFGDTKKIVGCVMKEVNSQSDISEGDYKQLTSFSVCLENNYNRLHSIDLEHELSNTSAMQTILRKFPRQVGEKWTECLSLKDAAVKSKPFPSFIEWIISQREIWEQMLVVTLEPGHASSGDAFFVDNGRSFSTPKKCYSCGEEGHLQRHCKKNENNPKQEKIPKPRKKPVVKKYWCALHKDDVARNCFTNACQDLRKMQDKAKRLLLLQENGDCFHCCGDHKPENCSRKERVCGGGRENRGCSRPHKVHELFCKEAQLCFAALEINSSSVKGGVVLSIMQVRAVKRGVTASVFWDLGCTSNFIREEFAKLCGFKGKSETLSVKTLGNVVTDYNVLSYRCSLKDENGDIQEFTAFGMESITGEVSKIGIDKIKSLFPHIPRDLTQRLTRLKKVDVLIGMEHPSWHPERAEKAKGGGDFWLFRGKFGSCVGGRHPEIVDTTRKSENLFTVVDTYHVKVKVDKVDSHHFEFCPDRVKEYVPSSNYTTSSELYPFSNSLEKSVEETLPSRTEEISVSGPREPISELSEIGVGSSVQGYSPLKEETNSEESLREAVPGGDLVSDSSAMNQAVACHGDIMMTDENFFKAESLGVTVDPKCGACKCSKCPIPGARFSFTEQQEFDIIQSLLFYNAKLCRWFVEYPWCCKRSTLPRNKKAAMQNLLALERRLQKHPEQAAEWCAQIQDMVNRGVAVILSEGVLDAWEGDFYFLPLVGVKGKKGWLRVCFNASKKQNGYPSMNDCLFKGPDNFLNNLLSVLIGFRNGRVGCAADISKFHNRVFLVEKDVHMQRFYWRDLKTDQDPAVYAVVVNNFGVKPANCIATSALHKSADEWSSVYPEESEELKSQTYVDDILISAVDKEQALAKTSRIDEISQYAGMPNKGWVFTGDEVADGVSIGKEGDEQEEKVLGISWIPKSDMFVFKASLSLNSRIKNDISVTSSQELKEHDWVITRRVMLSNVARIFDPLGFLCPLLLESKLLMRESWCVTGIGWDDPLPEDQAKRWFLFLSSLMSLRDVKFPRSLWPEGNVVGLPILVIFSDGAALAYGAVAYIRWKLQDGSYWSRIIAAKCKIAPKHIISVPRMELNGALIGNRLKNFILKETNFKFEKTYQFVDSSTVLGYLYKQCGVFHPYEGLRVAEIQASNVFENGKLLGWAWVSTESNPADWCTKPHPPEDLKSGSFWERGPDFLQHEESSWPIKLSYKADCLEGELKVGKRTQVFFQVCSPDLIGQLIERNSRWTRLLRVTCWLWRLASGRLGPKIPLSMEELEKMKLVIVKHAQKSMEKDLVLAAEKGLGRYRKLAPICIDGVWRVGSRLKNYVPFTKDHKMPIIISPSHRITLLLMREAHQFNHAGHDGTLCRFWSEGYWTVRAGNLARSIKSQCVPCRKASTSTLSQVMGEIPQDRLQDLVAWGHCQMDLFGPFSCRGDVNPRTSKKTWGIIIEDANSGAIHLDIVQDYSTNAVLTSLRRFGSLRGWPFVMYSDPGSQLESASGKLVSWWSEMKNPFLTFAGSKSFRWEISPADSPWRQGKVERHIGIVKRLLKLSVGDSRLSPVELQTSFFEIANICNERPIGVSKPRDDGVYLILTPNQLMTGRSGNMLPDDTAIVEDMPIAARYRIINHVASNFWKKWTLLVGPSFISRQKWHQKSRNVQVGDLVKIADSNKIKGKYKLGVVIAVTAGKDGMVRSATIRYFIRRGITESWTPVQVIRSVQRLTLILSVEEQEKPMMVKEDENKLQVCEDRS